LSDGSRRAGALARIVPVVRSRAWVQLDHPGVDGGRQYRHRACKDGSPPQSVRSADLSAECRACLCQFLHRRFCRSCRCSRSRLSVPCYLLTAALIRLGKTEDARSAAQVLLQLQPKFTVSGVVSGNITTPERMQRLADALREAGLPE